MSEDLQRYLLGELDDHIEQLMEVATSDDYSPTEQFKLLEYHSGKAKSITETLRGGFASGGR